MSEYLGLLAATCTTVAFFPQVLRALRTRDTSSISLSMYCLLVIGLFLWLVYGLLIHDLPIIIANSLTILQASVVLLLKIKEVASHSRKSRPH